VALDLADAVAGQRFSVYLRFTGTKVQILTFKEAVALDLADAVASRSSVLSLLALLVQNFTCFTR
jgi:hypothetical protein